MPAAAGGVDHGAMAVSGQDETERKYEVTHTAAVPGFGDADGVAAMGPPVVRELDAVYFDTAALDLTRHGVTLRRRTGGSDAGWHLKVPAGPDTRTERRLPLGRVADSVPAELLEPVRAVVRGRSLTPVARIRTRRHEYPLVGDDGVVLAIVRDDEVHAERLRGSPRAEDWREWEVELVRGPRSLLLALEPDLRTAGAVPSTAASKLARILGDTGSRPASRPSLPSRKSLARGTTPRLLQALLAAQSAELEVQDAGVRAERPGSVHRLRIAARRLRSALSTYRPLVEPGRVDPLRDELRWLGQTLGQARDAQVLRERLLTLLASEPDDLVLGPVADRIERDLHEAYRAGLAQAQETLTSDRYYRLLDALDALDGLTSAAPLTPRADALARDLVPRLLQRDADRLRRAVRHIEGVEAGAARDLALHEARKKAKRLRYSAEAAIPVFGDRAKTLARAAQEMQDSLGEHQDSVVARQRLLEYAAQAQLSGESSFTFGRLHALEQARADRAERSFHEGWAVFPQKKKLRRWIRK